MKYHIRVEGLPESPNKIGRAHWAVQAKHKKEWSEKVGWLAKTNKPSKPLTSARIHFCISTGDKRRHDPDNLAYAVTKPSLDGLKGYEGNPQIKWLDTTPKGTFYLELFG